MGTDPVTDAARPARRRSRRNAAARRTTDSLYRGLDRFGLAPVLLIGFAYIVHTQVVMPIADSYAKMVQSVAEANKLLAAASEEIRTLSQGNQSLNTKILTRLDELENAIRGKP